MVPIRRSINFRISLLLARASKQRCGGKKTNIRWSKKEDSSPILLHRTQTWAKSGTNFIHQFVNITFQNQFVTTLTSDSSFSAASKRNLPEKSYCWTYSSSTQWFESNFQNSATFRMICNISLILANFSRTVWQFLLDLIEYVKDLPIFPRIS